MYVQLSELTYGIDHHILKMLATIAMICFMLTLILVSVSSLVMTTRPLRRQGIINSVRKSYPLNDRSKQLLSSHNKHAFTSLGMSGSANEDLSNGKDDSLYQTIGIVGVVSNIVCDYSLYVLKTTGSGLPAGPYGLEGGLEGISYLAVVGIFIWSISTKVKTGSGLPAGPLGLLGRRWMDGWYMCNSTKSQMVVIMLLIMLLVMMMLLLMLIFDYDYEDDNAFGDDV